MPLFTPSGLIPPKAKGAPGATYAELFDRFLQQQKAISDQVTVDALFGAAFGAAGRAANKFGGAAGRASGGASAKLAKPVRVPVTPTVHSALRSGRQLSQFDKSGQLTNAGRALAKHGSTQGKRAGSSAFPKPTGTKADINRQGLEQLKSILEDPKRAFFRNGKGGFDVHASDGRGARFDANGNFKTFLEPRR